MSTLGVVSIYQPLWSQVFYNGVDFRFWHGQNKFVMWCPNMACTERNEEKQVPFPPFLGHLLFLKSTFSQLAFHYFLFYYYFLIYKMIPNTLYRLIRTGVVHPYAAYQTYKVYLSRDPMGAEHWNMYWMVIAAYMALELVTDIFLSWWVAHFSINRTCFSGCIGIFSFSGWLTIVLFRLPFYSMAKLLILIWLTALKTQVHDTKFLLKLWIYLTVYF